MEGYTAAGNGEDMQKEAAAGGSGAMSVKEAAAEAGDGETGEGSRPWPSLVLKLEDPYQFEGAEVKEIDLSGMFDLKARDMCEIDRWMIQEGYTGSMPEVTRRYAMLVAAKVNRKPWTYCDLMKARDCIRLGQMVRTFFYAKG